MGKSKLAALAVVGVIVAIVFFGLGFVSAVFIAGVDPTTAIQMATGFGRESVVVRDQLTRARFMARRAIQTPAFAAQDVAWQATGRATAALPSVLHNNPQVGALARRSDSLITEGEARYTEVLIRFENQAVAEAASQLPPAPGATGSAGEAAATSGDEAPGAEETAAVAAAAVPRRAQPASGQEEAPVAAYAVELGSFLAVERAESFAAFLAAENHPVVLVEQPDRAGRVWYHVRVGPFASYAAAARQRDRFAQAGLQGLVLEDISSETGAQQTSARPGADGEDMR